MSVHYECNIVVHGFSVAKQATKISTRCQPCRGINNYTNYGKASSGWKLYAVPRDYIEASDLYFIKQWMYKASVFSGVCIPYIYMYIYFICAIPSVTF